MTEEVYRQSIGIGSEQAYSPAHSIVEEFVP